MRSLSTRAAGLVIVVLGLWGGLVPFIGPYFHYSLGPTKAWTYTSGRLWLDIVPAAVAVIGGLMLINAGWRPHARLGALLALAAGIWFVIGPEVSILWKAAGAQGAPHGSSRVRMLEMLGYHDLLGVVIAALAAYILPRFPGVARVAAEDRAVAADGGAVAADRRGAPAAATRRERAVADEPVGGRGVADRPAADRPVGDRPVADRADEPVAGRGDQGPVGDAYGDEPYTGRTGVDTASTDRAGEYGHAGPARRRRRGGLLSVLSRR